MESDDCSVSLEEEKPDIFSLYLHILYGENLPLTSLKAIKVEDLPLDEEQVRHLSTEIAHDQIAMCHIYVLAEFIQSKNTVLKCLRTIFRDISAGMTIYGRPLAFIPGPEAIRVIYVGTPARAPARRFLVDAITRSRDYSEILTDDDENMNVLLNLPGDFVADLIRVLYAKMGPEENKLIPQNYMEEA